MDDGEKRGREGTRGDEDGGLQLQLQSRLKGQSDRFWSAKLAMALSPSVQRVAPASHHSNMPPAQDEAPRQTPVDRGVQAIQQKASQAAARSPQPAHIHAMHQDHGPNQGSGRMTVSELEVSPSSRGGEK